MHLQIILRGLPQNVELWKLMAQAQFFKWKRKDYKTGKDDDTLVQAGLRESVLGTYEYVFPKEALATVLAMMGVTDPKRIGCKNTFGRRLKLSVLRKMTGTKKIPKKYFEEAQKIECSIEINDSERGLSHLHHARVTPHIIGIKEDPIGDMVNPATGKGWIQELL